MAGGVTTAVSAARGGCGLAPPTDPLPTEAGACALWGRRMGAGLAAGPDFESDTTRTELALWRCPCGGVYLDPRPAPAALARIYPANYYAYDFVEKLGGFVMRFKTMVERAKVRAYRASLAPGGRVLDVGCGDGHVLAQLRRHAGVPPRRAPSTSPPAARSPRWRARRASSRCRSARSSARSSGSSRSTTGSATWAAGGSPAGSSIR